MQRMTIAGAFGATVEFTRGSWYVLLGTLVAVFALFGGIAVAAVGSGAVSGEPGVGDILLLITLVPIGYVATIACLFLTWRHGLARGQEPLWRNIGWAMGAGLASIVAMLVVGLVIGIGFYAVLFVVALLLFALFGVGSLAGLDVLSPAASGALGIGAVLLFVLVYLAFFIGYLWIVGRLSLAGPAMAVLRTRNPITGLGESWRLTKGVGWSIAIFYFILSLLAVVLFLGLLIVIGGTSSAMGELQQDGPTGGAAVALSLFPLFFSVFGLLVAVAAPAGIYRQVSVGGRYSADIFS